MRRMALFVVAMASAGCGGKTLYFTESALSVGETMDACPTLDPSVTLTNGNGDAVITSICARDETGRYYAIELDDAPPPPPGLTVLPAGHTYAIVYRFASGYVPAARAVGSSAHAYAAPDGIYGNASGCTSFPEDGKRNLTPSETSLDGDLLVQALEGVVPAGDQVVSELDVGDLFAGTPSCEAGGVCGGGFTIRFYVGHPPAGAPTSSGAPAGSSALAGPACR
jgi:hypothetical protein